MNTFELKGAKIARMPDISRDEIIIVIVRDNTIERWRFYHQSDCCESCHVVKVTIQGNILDQQIIEANDDHPDNGPDTWPAEYSFDYSHTWSRFIIRVPGGYLEFWFLGESNGYYGETVDIEVTPI